MNLKKRSVKHKAFGEGVVLDQQDSYIVVEFSVGEKKFQYPNAFDGFLSIDDKKLAKKIEKDLEKMKEIIKEEEIASVLQVEKRMEQIKADSRRSGSRSQARSNIAFKCNYCDGGKSEEQIGFNGICSDQMIENNVKLEKKRWCSSEDSQCRQYLEGNITREELDAVHASGDYVCYESQMLKEWKAMAGIVQTGKRAGQPMRLQRVQSNSLCILTSRLPDTIEEDRFIFAVFLVDESYEGDNREEGYVTTKSKYKLKLTSEEAENFLFWNYHANKSSPERATWNSGLHRYFEDPQAAQILKDIADLKKGSEDEELAQEFLEHFADVNRIDLDRLPDRSGALTRTKEE